jgi:trans-aconitate 2-methyltransferase
VARIAIDSPARVIDLGCGPGNSTRVLKARWPQAHVIGLDSSSDMIDAARTDGLDVEWVVADIEDWWAREPFDVVFSNAALHWLPDHGLLVERILGNVTQGGALAFQIPSTTHAMIRTLIHDVALGGPWASRMAHPLGALTMETPEFYYRHLAPLARSVDLWETEYFHVMDSAPAIVDWIASTGLRPFMDALESACEQETFLAVLHARVAEAYPCQRDGRVLLPFRRTFVVAYR